MASHRTSWTKGIISLVAITVVTLVLAPVVNRQGKDNPLAPSTNQDRPWRIAYYEGGTYFEYNKYLRALATGLAELGWIEDVAIPPFEDAPENNQRVWQYLAANASGQYIEFVADAYWSAEWDETKRTAARAAAIERLAAGGDIDLVIAMGTWAGQDLANDRHHTPTLVISTSDALKAGIISSADDTGYDHVHAWYDPQQYIRQIRLFHDIVNFQTLGVVYEDTPDGKVYANLEDLTTVADERGFQVITCAAPDEGVTEAEALQYAVACLEELAPQIDALWLSAHRGHDPRFMPGSLAPLFEYNIPTWSQTATEQVQRGALMSIAGEQQDIWGAWSAEIIAQILNGATPRNLPLTFDVPPRITINLETARRIGFEVPEGLLETADTVYETIAGEDTE